MRQLKGEEFLINKIQIIRIFVFPFKNLSISIKIVSYSSLNSFYCFSYSVQQRQIFYIKHFLF